MIRALLFDLDGTLVRYDFDAFLREYFQALARKVAHVVGPDKLVRQVLSSTMAMVGNLDPSKTNQQVFREDFFPKIGVPEDVLGPLFDEFYRRDFPRLRERLGIEPHPDARRMIEGLLARGFDVVIATNPLFPLVAIEERMRWGGLHGLPYRLVTSYERMHFCKPNVQYYEEVLALIGRKPQECLMVGNDVEEDLVAGKLGMRTYLVEGFVLDRGHDSNHADFRGDFRALVEFMRSDELGEL